MAKPVMTAAKGGKAPAAPAKTGKKAPALNLDFDNEEEEEEEEETELDEEEQEEEETEEEETELDEEEEPAPAPAKKKAPATAAPATSKKVAAAPAAEVKKGKPQAPQMHLIPLKQLVENPNNPREKFDSVKLKELATSIKENGLKVPFRVMETGETKNEKPVYMIISGHRRFRAIKLLGKEFGANVIKAEVQPIDYDKKQIIYDDLAFNDGEELTLLEQGKVFNAAREAGDTDAEIARKSGRSQTHIADCLMLHDNASDALKKKITTGKMSATQVLDLLKNEGAEKTEKLVAKAEAENPDKKITKKHLVKANDGEEVGRKGVGAGSAGKPTRVAAPTAKTADKPVETADAVVARLEKLSDALEGQEATRKENTFEVLGAMIKFIQRKIEAPELAQFFFEEEEED